METPLDSVTSFDYLNEFDDSNLSAFTQNEHAVADTGSYSFSMLLTQKNF